MPGLIESRRAAAITLSLLSLGVTATQPAQASTRLHVAHRVPTPPDSFLEYKVYTVNQLIDQVQENPRVRARFARHFQIPEDRVVSYMRANLVESYIPKTGNYTVYCASRGGRLYAVHQRFRQGTKVFALRNGQPVLKWVCGNPLSKFLPAVVVKQVTKPKPKVAGYIAETPSDTADILVPAEEATAFPAAFVLGPGVASAASFVGSGGSSLLPLLGALLFTIPHGGGGGGTTPHTPIPIVPEPVTAVYVILALPAVFWLARRRGVVTP